MMGFGSNEFECIKFGMVLMWGNKENNFWSIFIIIIMPHLSTSHIPQFLEHYVSQEYIIISTQTNEKKQI